MKNVKLFFLFALMITAAAPVWADTGATAQASTDPACIVNPATIVGPAVHPRRKYVHLHKTPQTKARAHALARLRTGAPLPVAINICQPTPPVVTLITPAKTCRDLLGASQMMTAAQVETMLGAAGYDGTAATLSPAMAHAMQMNPDAAPALYAYALQHTDPHNVAAIRQLSADAYAAAPGQVAGLAYGGTLANPGASGTINQSLLALASPADKSAILACSDIRTAAFVPSLDQPTAPGISRNDVLPPREIDNSAT